ncbi:MAG: hypothetical protein B6D74_10745 [gamma proteobacterium symbiont of Ctena orbiculata]|nr:MAG: hypothetical protein B6D74_10745 [gamma proteobacterium symbiont of Ctena orbiculata]
MDTNPYSHDDLAKASKHKIPPSPLNFRLGYDYVAGKSEELKAALDEMVTQSEALSTETLWEMYRRFFIQDDQALEKMRQELRHIIVNVQSEFARSGGNLSSYAQTLNRFADILDTSTTPERMSAEVKKVVDDTHSLEESQQRLESNMSHILTEVESLRKELEQVKEESLTDALTGISNRKAFDAALEHTVHSAREQKTPFCILLADIDRFKQFNDTYGHLVGDKVLRFVASTLKRCLKGKDMAARFGGEEFAVILPQTALIGAEAIAEQIRQAVSSGGLKDNSNGREYGKVTISIGIGQFRWNELPNELIQRIDRALYLAKERGRNRVEKAV